MKRVSGVVAALSSGLLGVSLTLAAGTGTAAVATAAPSILHAPRVPANAHGLKNTWAASNWSGYAETGSGFTGVSGTWTVPSVKSSPLSSTTYSSAWIGVDGFNNSNLIQTGTEEDWYNGAAHYNAWWEILPAAETPLPTSDVVKPNDAMSASIYKTTATSSTIRNGRFHTSSQPIWVITIADATEHWSFTTNQAYNGPGTSAEWIMEAPQVGGRIATLAPYTFSPSPATNGDFDHAGILKNTLVSSGTPTYTNAGLNYTADSGVMIQNNAQVSTPGNPGNANQAYNVAYGSAMPLTTPST
jgi:hypothetical protein